SGGFSDHEAAVLEQLSPHLAAALRNAHLLESLKQSLEEVTRAREKLRLANDELKSLDEMKTNLLSNVSHELRTPLVAVMGYTDMVLNEKAGPVTETQREYLRVSMRNVEKLVTLIENLLDFSRLHRGTEEMTFTRFDLLDCVRASMESVKPRSDARGIALRCEARDPSGAPFAGPIMVEGDKGKIGQVFNNLLSNAVKFNREGGEVAVLAELRHGTVSISVTDTGIGIPAEALDKVFDRFYQVDSSSTRKYEGTGIGLAISQDIVRLHGGRITVTSRLGEGATFHFTLPVVRPEEPDGGAGAAFSPETRLLVEVVSQDRALPFQVRSLLVPDGIDVIHAPNPASAVALSKRYTPDCILVDTEAGPLGAFVLEEMMQEPAGAEAPIVLLTNDDGLFEKYRRRRLVAARVRRTFRKSALLSAIHSAVSGVTEASRHLGVRVLCVDDDPEIGGVIARFLDDEGFAVDIVTTGAEAMARVKTGDYWLVLLDIALSDMDGWEVCRRIKGDPELAGIKVFLVTGRPVDNELGLLRDAGADGYLLKPFHSEDLMTAVRAFDAQRRKS
ncbi:MAG TPA: ATP-binding protein, partial [Candidatus Hydrogenedentes bacterium]|nr:ATP-binding protein [Candidatus Hydrogenedentota bacterium]